MIKAKLNCIVNDLQFNALSTDNHRMNEHKLFAVLLSICLVCISFLICAPVLRDPDTITSYTIGCMFTSLMILAVYVSAGYISVMVYSYISGWFYIKNKIKEVTSDLTDNEKLDIAIEWYSRLKELYKLEDLDDKLTVQQVYQKNINVLSPRTCTVIAAIQFGIVISIFMFVFLPFSSRIGEVAKRINVTELELRDIINSGYTYDMKTRTLRMTPTAATVQENTYKLKQLR